MAFLGNSSAATGEDGTGGFRVAVPVVATEDGSVTSLFAWARNAVGVNQIDIGIKDDNAGTPGILLSSTGSLAESVGASLALHSASVTTVAIVNGATYWIELCNRVGAPTFGDHKAGLLTGGTLYFCGGLGFAGDDNWNSEPSVGTSPGDSLAAYAVYTPSVVGASSGLPDLVYNRPPGVNRMTGPWGMVAEALRALGSTVIPSADVALIVDDLFIALGIDALALTQANVLVVQDAAIALNVDSPTLTQQNTLVVADASIALAIDSPSLTQANVLAIADALIALSAESPTLTQANVLVVADALIALAAESPTLVQANLLAVADALIGLSIESPTPELPGLLSVADALIGLTIQPPTLTQANVLAVADALVALSIEAPALVQNYILTVADALVALTIETPTLTLGLGAEVRVTRIRVNRSHAILRDRSTVPILRSRLSGPTLRQAA